jgi:hypothetical protein
MKTDVFVKGSALPFLTELIAGASDTTNRCTLYSGCLIGIGIEGVGWKQFTQIFRH